MLLKRESALEIKRECMSDDQNLVTELPGEAFQGPGISRRVLSLLLAGMALDCSRAVHLGYFILVTGWHLSALKVMLRGRPVFQ